MFLKPVIPHPQLAPFIQSFWIFQSDLGHAATSSRVIAPNGCLKIVLPFENALFAESRSVQQQHKEGKIQFIGNADEPYVINTYARRTGTLIIELTPQGACRFAPFAMSDITNNIVPFTDVYGKEGACLEKQIGNTTGPEAKAALLQDFMVKKIREITPQQIITDYSVNAILKSNGCVRIKTLEKQTGYSKRYLDMLFQNHVGLSPKTLSSVTRFQYFHLLWAKNPSPGFYRNEVFKFYYDQAHFIKEFKRFSGQTPEQYAISDNELGRIFYRD
jgi:AraC-like DNA-binding protein